MKVAVLAHSFPRFPGDTHGPFVERLSQELGALGHEIHLLVPWDPELRTGRREGITVHAFRYVWPPRAHLLGYSRTLQRDQGLKLAALLESPLYFLFGVRALGRLVRREGIELVHAHWILPNGWIAARVRRATGVPFAATLHGSDVFMAERNPLFAAMARRALADAAHVTSCSSDLRDRLLALGRGRGADRVLLVPNGTDAVAAPSPETRGTARARWGLGVDETAIVAVGRLVDKKGFDVLLDAFPTILAGAPNARLVIGGGGPLAEPLARRAAGLGIAGRVTFTGALSHPDVLALIGAADLFVMPSVRDPRGNVDGLPIVLLEAMAAGVPTVASAVAGMPLAITSGEHGVLVPERDPAALAAAVAALLADRATAGRLGAAARRRVQEELNWAAVARIHDRLYRTAAAGAPPAVAVAS